ncbi:hypothetical protein HDU98_005059 [Podochytrium sp. JEL0797]|nr:hypothetical protein HDU98_005059 [Podochytrium sp. JEL0797]
MQNATRLDLPRLFAPVDPNASIESSNDRAADTDSETPSAVFALLFESVKNAKDIKSKVIAGSPDMPQCVMVNPAMILDAFQLQTACVRAYMNQSQNAMKTKTILSEILFSLSPTLNISESMKRFGLSDSSTSIFVLFPSSVNTHENDQMVDKIVNAIDGECVPIESFSRLADLKAIKKPQLVNHKRLVRDTPDAHSSQAEVSAALDRECTDSLAKDGVIAGLTVGNAALCEEIVLGQTGPHWMGSDCGRDSHGREGVEESHAGRLKANIVWLDQSHGNYRNRDGLIDFAASWTILQVGERISTLHTSLMDSE